MATPKVNTDMLREDAKNLSSRDFEKKYHGIKQAAVQRLSDAELEKVAGGGGKVPNTRPFKFPG